MVARTRKTREEYSPIESPNAAPSLWMYVSRRTFPITGTDSFSVMLARIHDFVSWSRTSTAIGSTVSYDSEMRRGRLRVSEAPSILLSRFAGDAEGRVRQRLQTLPGDPLVAELAVPESLGLLVQASQRAVDLVQLAPLLRREQERLLALHCVGALIGHVEGVRAEVPGRRARRVMVVLVEESQLLEHLFPFLQQP